MARKTISIMGATGHVGKVLTEELLKKGHKVRAMGRSHDKLIKLKEKGAEITSSDFEDANALSEFFKGADAAFTFLPPAYYSDDYETYQDQVIEAIKTAIQKTELKKIVNLSSIGAQLPAHTGPIKSLQRAEAMLNAQHHLDVLHLRPGYFMENFSWSIPSIKMRGVNGSTLRADLALSMIATQDIGEKAADFLDQLNFRGKEIFEIIGPHSITFEEATTILGKAIGKPELIYIQFPLEEAERSMIAAGMKPKTARLLLEMQQAINEGKIKPTQDLTQSHMGKTSLETFAKTTFNKMYQGSEKTLTSTR